MARPSGETRNILIGALTIAVLAMFFALGYRGNPEKYEGHGYRLYAVYDTAIGLEPGSQVLLAGLPIGTVRRLELDKETNEAQVEMTIDEGVEIPIDSEAAIVSDGFSGGKYIRVIPGGEYNMLQPDEFFDYVRGTVNFVELFERIVIMAEARRQAARQEN